MLSFSMTFSVASHHGSLYGFLCDHFSGLLSSVTSSAPLCMTFSATCDLLCESVTFYDLDICELLCDLPCVHLGNLPVELLCGLLRDPL